MSRMRERNFTYKRNNIKVTASFLIESTSKKKIELYILYIIPSNFQTRI